MRRKMESHFPCARTFTYFSEKCDFFQCCHMMKLVCRRALAQIRSCFQGRSFEKVLSLMLLLTKAVMTHFPRAHLHLLFNSDIDWFSFVLRNPAFRFQVDTLDPHVLTLFPFAIIRSYLPCFSGMTILRALPLSLLANQIISLFLTFLYSYCQLTKIVDCLIYMLGFCARFYYFFFNHLVKYMFLFFDVCFPSFLMYCFYFLQRSVYVQLDGSEGGAPKPVCY